jgi:hypothetical protein
MLKLTKVCVTAAVVLLSSQAFAGEVSLLKGFYQGEKIRDQLETTNISLGGRFLDSMGGKMAWYVDFSMAIKSYSAPSNEPGNKTDIKGGGGVRMKTPPLAEKIIPYISGGLFYETKTTQPTWSPTTTTWTQDSGIFYDGALGLHILLSSDFFMDLESSMFTSALAGKSVDVTKTPTGETKGETDRTDLFINTTGAFSATRVALGLKF